MSLPSVPPLPRGPDLDECRVKSLCQHACRNTEGSYYCLCPSGYRLLPSGKNCQGEPAGASPSLPLPRLGIHKLCSVSLGYSHPRTYPAKTSPWEMEGCRGGSVLGPQSKCWSLTLRLPLVSLSCVLSSHLPPHPTAQTSTSVRKTASSVGLARCASTLEGASSVWTHPVPPPTGRAPALGKEGPVWQRYKWQAHDHWVLF